MAAEFSLLGAIEAREHGRPVALGHARQRQVLAVLLVDADRLAPVGRLVDRVWGERAPQGVQATLYSYVSRLRRALSLLSQAVTIQRGPGGYLLAVDPGAVDLHRFRSLTARARAADDGQATALFEQALDLWRGEPFATVDSPWFNGLREALHRERFAAELELNDLRLRGGRTAEVVTACGAALAAQPFNERVAGQLMLALYRSGRTADALACYESARRRLAEELGVDPGEALNRLHTGILGADPALATPAPPEDGEPEPAVRVRAWSPPALLPSGVPDFTGRPGESAALREQLTGRAGVTVIAGMGGVGKTALALHAARQAAEAYPDGQLWANLRGAEASPLKPGDVLARFLRAFGLADRAIPAEPAERAELYRTLLAGRKVLVLLDNAASEEQVRPLLPATPGSAVVITSRARLTALEGARRIDLDVFTAEESVGLLARVAGEHRVRSQAEDAAEIVSLCGALPLGVRIAGARLAARPAWRLAHLAAQLRDARLDRLATGDLAVRASLTLSYQGLDERSRRLFRLLGLFEVPDFPAWLAATVLDCPVGEATEHAEALVDAHLLSVSGTDPAGQYRYRFHDLVRLFAAERAEAEEPEDERRRVVSRGLGGWLALAERMAAKIPGPCYASISGDAVRPRAERLLRGFRDEWADSWFDAERAALLSAVRQACRLRDAELAFDLAGCLEKYFDLRGMYADWAKLDTEVMTVCRDTGHRLGEAVMLRGLLDVTTWITDGQDGNAMARLHAEALRLLEVFTGLGHQRGMSDAAVMCAWSFTATGAYTEAVAMAERALGLAEISGHLGGRIRAELALALAHFQNRRVDIAIAHADNALEHARILGNPRCEATALQFAGIGHRELSRFGTSRRMLEESLAISRRYRDNYTEVLTLLALARLHFQCGDPEAVPTAQASLALSREYRMTHHLAEALELLGELELAAGNPAGAVPYLEESVALWRTRGWHSYLATALTGLGKAHADTDPRAAASAFEEARALFDQAGDPAKAAEVGQLAERAGEWADLAAGGPAVAPAPRTGEGRSR
ncbi:AfsR/SARP family transcriptional regulator [Amycolatopsis sp. 195334CR]|uniref:AfsR/SARP family transcriptional regulator n=1 Tax=Amycolatopsis sp. 195334CR TaxID=2814588 RepID=UPI001A8C10C0|nr:AfsR/SARP family transcriptional regulator [Amycolatopsis sp. 195334CR]MBN6037636.1 tetratricopeptide repeat protein [Amycolatopsis sp. 195334CR]